MNNLLNFEAGMTQTLCLVCSNRLRFFTTVHETLDIPLLPVVLGSKPFERRGLICLLCLAGKQGDMSS